MTPIQINDIDYSLQYEGYVWYSGERKPELIDELFNASYFDPAARDRSDSLFIVEGNLYAAEKQRSISIRFIDGAYQIHQADLAGIPEEQRTDQRYRSHRLDGIQQVKMMQYWAPTPDTLLEGMETLMPAWTAFVGFVK
jgi:CRISPR type III-associated protein (TIGR04423 family)